MEEQVRISFSEELDDYYRKLLSETSQIAPSIQQLQDVQKAQKRLYDLHVELSSISHEKNVLEKLMKDVSQKLKLFGPTVIGKDQQSLYQRGTKGASSSQANIDVDNPIPIPPYTPPYQRRLSVLSKGKNTSQLHSHGFDPNLVKVKNTRNTTLVPNVKQSDKLPSELQNLNLNSFSRAKVTKKKR